MQKVALKDQVYKSILQEILDGKFSMDSIINEKVLSEQFAVSKTPVREALVRLCSEGILENLPRYGYRLIPVTQNEIQEIIEYRKVMEVEALRLSFDYIGSSDIERLRQLDAVVQEAVISKEDAHLAWEKNESFHWELGELCPNRYFRTSIKNALTVGNRYANQYFSNIWKEEKPMDRSHSKIIEALERKDLAEAQRILIFDIELMKDTFL